MKRLFFYSVCFIFLISCQNSGSSKSSVVTNAAELATAIKDAKPGTEIVMANGDWKDIEIRLTGKGTADKPITLWAETAGKVFYSLPSVRPLS